MDDKLCEIRHKRLDEKIEVQDKRLNNHSERLDSMERKIVAQEKDTTHLQNAIKSLQISIDKLIEVVDELKSKPLEKYEKIGMVVMSAIIGYLVSKWF